MERVAGHQAPGYPPQPTSAPESELQYAAREADEALHRLNKTVAELVQRLQIVLVPDIPSTVSGAEKAQRAVHSPIGNALMQHAQQTDAIMDSVRNVLNRLAL